MNMPFDEEEEERIRGGAAWLFTLHSVHDPFQTLGGSVTRGPRLYEVAKAAMTAATLLTAQVHSFKRRESFMIPPLNSLSLSFTI